MTRRWCLLDLVTDSTTGRLRETAVWSNIGKASKVTKKGDMKEIEAALASGTCLTEKKKKIVEVSCNSDRAIWAPGCLLFSTPNP
jgi:hypothetical protein